MGVGSSLIVFLKSVKVDVIRMTGDIEEREGPRWRTQSGNEQCCECLWALLLLVVNTFLWSRLFRTNQKASI